VGTLRLLEAGTTPERHQGEIYSCAFSPDGAFVLSAGWDGLLRFWDTATGVPMTSLQASPKPLSCCAFSPDGRQWLSGSMEGLFSVWDGVSGQSLLSFMAHTRPISSITFSPDGQTLVTTSWDRQVTVRKVGKEREGRNLAGHTDIVAGARFTPDGTFLISWSYDGTIKIWDLALAREVGSLSGHTDRVTSASFSPDGRWLLTGGRDGMARLWDLETKGELAALNVGAEVRACFCLPDAESAAVVDAAGRVFLFDTPSFQVQAQLQVPFKVMTADLSPSGMQVALGGEDGVIHFVGIDGFENASLVVTAMQTVKEQATIFDRMFGKTRMARVFSYTCPACRHTGEAPSLPSRPVACTKCHRQLKINPKVPVLASGGSSRE
jgi:WD40 repeat protein